MGEEQRQGAASAEGGDGPPEKRRNVTILLAFLGAFLLLLIVFRTVLFPFLMAVFVAYLVEPVVARVVKSRLFGIKWARGPALVLLYVLVVGGLTFGAWKGLTSLADMVRDNAQDLAAAAEQETPRARFLLPDDVIFDSDILIPEGALLQHTKEGLPAPILYRTQYAVRIEAGDSSGEALLRRDTPENPGLTRPPLPRPDDKVRHVLTWASPEPPAFADGTSLPEGVAIEVLPGIPANGIEVLLEDRLVTPLANNLERAGMDVEPSGLRAFLTHKAEALSEDLPDRISQGAVSFATRIAMSIYQFFLILMLTAFIVTDRRGISQFFTSLAPPRYRASYLKLVEYIDDGLAGVIRGQLMICLVNGVLTWIGLILLGVKGATLLSVVAAVLSLIPIFGTIVSSIPIVLIAATDGIDKGALALGWIVLIHFVEANMLNPIIMGSHARMHPVVIVFALLAGEHSFGVWGALLAVPTMSIIQACFRFYMHEIEGMPQPEHEPHGAAIRGWLGRMWGRIRGNPATSSGGDA